MGGLVFTSGINPLHTPRMSPSVYRIMRERYSQILRQAFVIVATPIEGPAKKDFGDIDFFLMWLREDVFPLSKATSLTQLFFAQKGANVSNGLLEMVTSLLGGVRLKKQQSGVAAIAIPWPKDLLPQETAIDTNHDTLSNDSPTQRYIQVDVHVCSSLHYLQWMLFKHAHGDLWNLLGSTIRPFGLTVDEVGMWIRIPEIEALHRNKAKVLLTVEPTEILSFLGLKCDGAQWEEPFGSMQEVFEYAATCRLFWVRPHTTDNDAADDWDGTADKCKLKSNDRRRMNHRPLFRQWIDEFIPQCRASGRFTTGPAATTTRAQVRDEAFAAFPGVEREYFARLREWRVQCQRERLWRDVIKPALPTAEHEEPSDKSLHYRGCAASALKKIIMSDDRSFGIEPPGASLRDGGGGGGDTALFDEDKVRAWVAAHWREVGDAAWKRNHALHAKKMKKDSGNANDDNDNNNTTTTKRTASGCEKVEE
ncbi:hypothetical protein F5X99DRAFT_417070 [Biscogniauxia marginata]|nr:hypothetical protein F5X99DRAFT_417070 [Biscogniauxia marginata]